MIISWNNKIYFIVVARRHKIRYQVHTYTILIRGAGPLQTKKSKSSVLGVVKHLQLQEIKRFYTFEKHSLDTCSLFFVNIFF